MVNEKDNAQGRLRQIPFLNHSFVVHMFFYLI